MGNSGWHVTPCVIGISDSTWRGKLFRVDRDCWLGLGGVIEVGPAGWTEEIRICPRGKPCSTEVFNVKMWDGDFDPVPDTRWHSSFYRNIDPPTEGDEWGDPGFCLRESEISACFPPTCVAGEPECACTCVTPSNTEKVLYGRLEPGVSSAAPGGGRDAFTLGDSICPKDNCDQTSLKYADS